MKGKFICLLLAALLLFGCAASVFAEGAVLDGDGNVIPVTLTVVRNVRSIDVTLPAALPVSVVDGTVLTADNLAIVNNSSDMRIVVSSVSVTSGTYTVASYSDFPSGETKQIALSINGCGTTGAGALELSQGAFPDIAPNTSLPIRYQARVASSDDETGTPAASVVFTLRAESASN